MVVGLGENRSNGRRCILITLDEADILTMLEKGIELSADVHQGFPSDLEVCLVLADDQVTVDLAREHHPGAAMIPQQAPRRES